ncbi:MAG: sugar phosphate nucleotidyltransferase [Bacteroidota bacterium]
MKALIPVAGIGTKLRPHTHTQPKPLIPVAGKPILGHIIENLIEAGITKQIFVIGYLREKIQSYVEDNFGDKIEAEFVVQEPRKGLAHALWVAREEIKGAREIVINLGDTIFGPDTNKVVQMEGSVFAVQEVDDPREFGVAMLDHEGYVTKLDEKPEIPTSNLALVGMYKIAQVSLLLEVLDEMVEREIAPYEEYALTDALMVMVKRKVQLRTLMVENWFDCGRQQSLLLANRILLERANLSQNFEFEGSVIIPPVHIAEGCEIVHSIVGPNVAIAEHARIHNSIVRNSILGAYSNLESIILHRSVIGNDTSLRGKSNRINIGDNTEIDFEQ